MAVLNRRLLLVALAGVVLATGFVGATAATASGKNRVARRVTLAGHNIGGMTRSELRTEVVKINKELQLSRVHVTAPKGGFSSTGAALGVALDINRTISEALEVGHKGNPIGRAAGWVRSLVSARPAPVHVLVDRDKVHSTVRTLDPKPGVEAKEPSIARKGGVFIVVPGQTGTGIDPADVAEELPDAVRAGLPVKLKVDRGRVSPRFTTADAEAVARQANKLSSLALRIAAAGETATVPPGALAGWLEARPVGGSLRLVVNGERASGDLPALIPAATKPATETKWSVVGDRPVYTAGSAGTSCCDPAKVEQLLTDAIRRPPAQPIALPLQVTEPKISGARAEELAIKEPVGRASTSHPAGQPRVKNIHRIADLVRGQVILPNSRLSINNLVGRRTAAKGFVNAPVIEDGRFSEDIGGGVSQFATTLFNAAFHAGLSIPTYQSHSIYIKRYPYGREATLNFPQPDLVIENKTPYGVLVWPTYSATTISVTLYSTKHAPGTQIAQSESKSGVCTVVKTIRERTFPDGRKSTDTFTARYRPQEGVNCDGSGTPVTSTTRPTATTKPAPATTSPPTTAAPPPPTTAAP
ncbi:MAG TPA: VanW family protein [Acidimicrobiales bacterium]|nr:VanW family protein [Acidimicrobiales bacterium]